MNPAKIERTFEQIDEALGVRPTGYYYCIHTQRFGRWGDCETRAASGCHVCGKPYQPGDRVETVDCNWAHVECVPPKSRRVTHP